MKVRIRCLECGQEYEQEINVHKHQSLIWAIGQHVCGVCGGGDIQMTFNRLEVLE